MQRKTYGKIMKTWKNIKTIKELWESWEVRLKAIKEYQEHKNSDSIIGTLKHINNANVMFYVWCLSDTFWVTIFL